jgi:hypothetical protein
VAYFSDRTAAYSECGEVQHVTAHWVYAFGRKFRVAVGRAVSPARPDSPFLPGGLAMQGQMSPDLPVNDAEIIPPVGSIASGLSQPPRLNGFSSGSVAASHFQGQQQSQF